jgi:hypothetical protein
MFTCPCCGYEVFDEHPGSYEICPICFREDDVFQLYFPHQGGGPNHTSLGEAQVNFIKFGACDRAMAKMFVVPAPMMYATASGFHFGSAASKF